MRLGCCGTLEEASVIKAAGFDFLEVNVREVLRGDEPSATWEKAAPDPDKLPLPIEAANCLVPPTRPIIGPQRDFPGLQDYMQRVAKRAQRLGIQRLVFGSGAARKRPDGVNGAQAGEQLDQFTRMAGEICAHHGIILVLEHLNRGETNTLNKLAEAQRLCDHVNHPNVAMLLDSFHYGLEHENISAILALDGQLRHVHVAEPVGRRPPGSAASPAQAFDFDDFFCQLRKIGYNERISVECHWPTTLADGAAAAAGFLRDAWARAGQCEC